MDINSRDYWERRFGTDWNKLGGPAQTRFFARLAVDAMPAWFAAQVRSEHLSICDWGCAEGEGASLLAEALGATVTGIDFSPEAIERAKSKFPAVEFRVADLLIETLDLRFDVVFSSNTLEHFHRPWEVFDAIAEHADRHVALLLPFRETDRHPEHFYGFESHSMPVVRGDWVLTHAAVLDAAQIRESMWPGQQLLVIYSRRREVERLGLALGMMRMDTPHLEDLRAQAVSLTRVVNETRNAVSSDMRDHIGMVQSTLIEAFSQDIRRMQDVVVAASERAAASDAVTEALKDRLSLLTEQHSQLQHAFEATRQENHAASSQLTALRDEYAAFQQTANCELSALRSERERAASELSALRIKHDAMQQSANELSALCIEHDAFQQRAADELGSLRRENAVLKSEQLRLLEVSRQFELVVGSRTWRWTRPVRGVARLLSGRLAPSDIDQLAGLAQRVVARMPLLGAERRGRLMLRLASRRRAAPGSLPDQAIASAMPLAKARDLPDVYVWSVIDWHFRVQRPQHLARALAGKGHRVFYISVNFVDSDEPGFHIDALDGCGNLQQIHFNLRGEPLIYSAMPSPEEVRGLQASLGQLLAWTRTRQAISIVQHPYWNQLAWSVPNAQVVYDCMDHHAGFENNANVVIEAEEYLVRNADLVVVTSSWLEREVGKAARYTKIVRNAGEFEFFRDPPAEVFSDPQGRRVIGYFGAIADWFDLDLVAAVAMAMPERLVLLVGHDSINARSALGGLPNVLMVGEVPYAKLPYWLHGFDACLLPFKVTALTQATNPVKVYEYLAAGKPVVSVDLPEMAQFGDLVRVGHDTREFIGHVRVAVEQLGDEDERARRQAFAAQQTWGHRAAEFDEAMGAFDEAVVSIVVLAYNNLEFTRACLSSIELYSDYRNLEVIVVDNASSDGSVEFLRAWVEQPSPAGHRRKLLLNEANLGFAAGNNIGLAAAQGEVLVLLNNDTYVTPGWVRDLRNHLRRDPRIGLVGPLTNNIGNEARIEIAYGDMEQMRERALQHTLRCPGVTMPMRTVAFFCVAMPRQVYEQVGPLDEAFGQGFFEDDDYCRRVELAGWKVACAENVFVHHHLSASFDQLKAERRAELFERNKATYEAKWGPWEPHSYRDEGPSWPAD